MTEQICIFFLRELIGREESVRRRVREVSSRKQALLFSTNNRLIVRIVTLLLLGLEDNRGCSAREVASADKNDASREIIGQGHREAATEGTEQVESHR